MSYVLDMRELVHKLPFHHFTPYEIKQSCIVILVTYALPFAIAFALCFAYFIMYTVKNKTMFENTNINEHKTRALITVGVIIAFTPAALMGLIEGVNGSLKRLNTIKTWTEVAQSGLKNYGMTLMAMDDALTMLRVEADGIGDVGAVATMSSALESVKTAMMNHGKSAEFYEDLDFFKWYNFLKNFLVTMTVGISMAMASLLMCAVLPLVTRYAKKPIESWWRETDVLMSPEKFVRSIPLWTLMFCCIVGGVFWPASVMGAEMCFAYDLMVEFQLPDSMQFYFLCPKYGYNLGDFMASLNEDKASISSAVTSVDVLSGSFTSSPYMTGLSTAQKAFTKQYNFVAENFGDCQPMSDTVELTIHNICDEVIIGTQMLTIMLAVLSGLLMYGTLHRWLGSDVLKQLAGDDEESLFHKLSKEDGVKLESKFGSTSNVEGTPSKLKKKSKNKKTRTWKRGEGETESTRNLLAGESDSESESQATGDSSQGEGTGDSSQGEASGETTPDLSPRENQNQDEDDAPAQHHHAVDIQMTDFLNDDEDFEPTRAAEPKPAARVEDSSEFTDPNFDAKARNKK